MVALIGANGAGKTTTLKAICGSLAPAAGACITVAPTSPARRRLRWWNKVWRWCRRDAAVFGRLTVRGEPARWARIARHDAPGDRPTCSACIELFPRLYERRRQTGGTLSGGEQQMLADRPRADERAEAAAAGRAQHGTGAAHGAADLRDHPESRRRRRDACCWWSRTPSSRSR